MAGLIARAARTRGNVTATDALRILQAAVGSFSCAECVCDVDGSGSILATDALLDLRFAVGENVTLSCPPCPATLTGHLTLPAGTAIAPTDLTILTATRTADPVTDGSFSVGVPPSHPDLLLALDDQDRIVLLGFFDPADGAASLNASSTALALLYFATGCYTLPADTMPDILGLLEADDALAPLTAAVSDALAASPTALADGDPNLLAALETAANEVLDVAGARSPVGGTSAVQLLERLAQETNPNDIAGYVDLVPDSDVRQSGLVVVAPKRTGVAIAKNQTPRPGLFRGYRVGGIKTNGNKVVVDPPELVGESELYASRLLAGQVQNLVADSVGWQPADSDPIPVSIAADALRTDYALITLGPSLMGESGPAFDDPRFAALVPEWRTKQWDLQVEALLGSFVVPVVAHVAFGSNYFLDKQTGPTTAAELRGIFGPSLSGFGLRTLGGFRGAVGYVLQEAAADDSMLDPLVRDVMPLLTDEYWQDQMSYWEQLGSPFAREAAIGNAKRAIRALARTGALSAAVTTSLKREDFGGVIGQLLRSRDVELWEAHAGRVAFHPSVGTVTNDAPSTTFTVKILSNNLADTNFLYRWRVEGLGHFTTDLGESGTEILTTEGTVQYLVDPSRVVDGYLATVKLDVFLADGPTPDPAAKGTVGRAEGEVDGFVQATTACPNFPAGDYQSTPMTVSASPDIVRPGDIFTVTFTYDWTKDPNLSGVEDYDVWVWGGASHTFVVDGVTRNDGTRYNAPETGWLQPWTNTDVERKIGFGDAALRVRIKIPNTSSDPDRFFKPPPGVDSHSVTFTLLDKSTIESFFFDDILLGAPDGVNLCPFKLAGGYYQPRDHFWTGPLVLVTVRASFRIGGALGVASVEPFHVVLK